jgi:hypothetical protein
MPCCTSSCCAAPLHTVPHLLMSHHTSSHHAAPLCTVLHLVVPCHTSLCHTAPHLFAPCCTLCHTSHHTTFPHTMPHFLMLHHACTMNPTSTHPLIVDMYCMAQEIQAEMAYFNVQLASTNVRLTKLKRHDCELHDKIPMLHNSQSPTFMTSVPSQQSVHDLQLTSHTPEPQSTHFNPPSLPKENIKFQPHDHLGDMPQDTSVTHALPVTTPQLIPNHMIEDSPSTHPEENVKFQPYSHLGNML